MAEAKLQSRPESDRSVVLRPEFPAEFMGGVLMVRVPIPQGRQERRQITIAG